MKFKDKDGNVFEEINAAVSAYCRKYQECKPSCPLFWENFDAENGIYGCCADSKRNNPAEAARLMGYEVVEDARTAPSETP